MKTLPTLLLAALLASSVALSGCLAGIAGITGQTGSPGDDGDPLGSTTTPGATDTPAPGTGGTNTTLPTSPPPVARMSIVDGSGAQVYKAEFEALDETGAPVFVTEGDVSFLASDSEALDGGRIESYQWTITPGNLQATGRSVTISIPEPGLYTATLTVTDNRNGSDTQSVALGVLPLPFTTTETVSGTIVAGAEGVGLPANGAHTFTVLDTAESGLAVEIKAISLVLTPKPNAAGANTGNYILALANADGEIADANSKALGEGETLTVTNGLAPGDYTATVSLEAGVNAEYDLAISVTYLEVVEELVADGGDGHGHAH